MNKQPDSETNNQSNQTGALTDLPLTPEQADEINGGETNGGDGLVDAADYVVWRRN